MNYSAAGLELNFLVRLYAKLLLGKKEFVTNILENMCESIFLITEYELQKKYEIINKIINYNVMVM